MPMSTVARFNHAVSCTHATRPTALDPYFYLAAAMFATGRRWTVGEELFHSFGPMTYFFHVLDISEGRPRLLGVYTYTRIAWDAPEPEPEDVEARLG